jgi:hypothetical protein
LFVDEQALGEAAAEVVGTHFLEVLVASCLSCAFGSPSNHSTDAGLGQIDEGVLGSDIVLVLETLEVTLDAVWEERIARLPTVATGVFPGLNAQPVLPALGFLDIDRADLWDLEGAQADKRPELNDDIVALAVGGPTEVLDFTVGEPDFVLVSSGRLNTHYDYFIFRY